MIYHFLLAERMHLSPGIIREYCKNLDSSSFVFILYKCIDKDRSIYINIAKDYKCEIVFVNSCEEILSLIPEKSSAILLHSLYVDWIVYLAKNHYSNVNAVCWGAVPKLKYPYFLYWIKHHSQALGYNNLKTVVALMTPDEGKLRKFFKTQKILTISYMGNSDREQAIESFLMRRKEVPNIKPRIYVGNNPFSLPEYCQVAKNYIYRFKDRISVLFMLNYGLKENKYYQDLCNIVQDYPDWFFDKVRHPIEEYVDYMGQCDIYISGCERQTGLGAIHTCLQLGKKIYVTGVNLQWVRLLGCKVYSIEDITKMSYEEFIKPLTKEEKRHNREIISNVLSDDVLSNKWNNYFLLLQNKKIENA